MKDTILLLAIRWLKFGLAGLFTFLFRLLTYQIQLLSPNLFFINLSPLMATEFSGARVYGPRVAAIYAVIGMVAIDLATNNTSMTVFTAPTYGALAFLSMVFLRRPRVKRIHYVQAAVVGTLIFDLVTGVLIAPIHGQSFANALVLQIPVTIMSLITNIGFALFCPLMTKMFADLRFETKVVPQLGLLH